ncbi:MAG: stage V sporulation protein AC [Bacillota bacterium]
MKKINKTDDEYNKIVQEHKPKKKKIKNFIKAYITGGLICLIGQSFWNLYMYFNIPQTDAGTLSVITMIFIGGLLTGIGIYDEIAQFSGAGTLVPITGFANSMVSPALEYKQDDFILGMGAKMFSVAGPVLVYGIVSSFIIGVLKTVLEG